MPINIKGALREISSNKNISDQYDSTKTYSVGDLSIHGNTLFKCIVPVDTPEEFDSSKWVQTNIADEIKGSPNVINASEIVNNTLTQEQYNLITNGKPTVIKGTFASRDNQIWITTKKTDNLLTILSIGSRNQYDQTYITQIQVNANKLINYNDLEQIFMNHTLGMYLNKIYNINNKVIPDYPNDTTKQYKFVQKVGGNLDYIETTTEWYGTQAEYKALGTYDSNTIYNIFEEE